MDNKENLIKISLDSSMVKFPGLLSKVSKGIDLDSVNKTIRERDEREKRLLENTSEMVQLQKETNEILKVKLDSANKTLDFILNSIGYNSQKIDEELIENNKLLAEITTILQIDKDGSKTKEFIDKHGVNCIGVILQLISFILKPGP